MKLLIFNCIWYVHWVLSEWKWRLLFINHKLTVQNGQFAFTMITTNSHFDTGASSQIPQQCWIFDVALNNSLEPSSKPIKKYINSTYNSIHNMTHHSRNCVRWNWVEHLVSHFIYRLCMVSIKRFEGWLVYFKGGTRMNGETVRGQGKR